MNETINSGLMQALHFSADDLAANRKGMLTEAQRARYATRNAQGMRAALGIAAVVIVVVLAVIVYILLGTAGIVALPEDPFGSEPLLVAGVLSVILIYYVIMVVFRARRIASGGAKVTALTGKVKVTGGVVKVGGAAIYSGDPAVGTAFAGEGIYRVYVAGSKPGTVILSAEFMGAG